jgi:tRNA A37 N6-isopentenylltransferase MiaA
MTDKEFSPSKYYAGLTRKQKIQRKKEIQKFGAKSWKDPKAYVGFKTDKFGPKKPSQYTQRWRRRFPDAYSLKDKSKVTGVPLKYIKKSYNRGLAAWRTGHRPGATEQQWGYARVHSLLQCGKTSKSADADIVRNASRYSKKAKKWFKQCEKID